jgi:hypothetical protein
MSDSFYLQRVKTCLTKVSNRYDQVGAYQFTRWYNTSILPTIKKVTLREITFHEETYMGYQLIVIGWHRDLQEIFDKNNEPFTHSSFEESEVARYGAVEQRSAYSAYAWKIGTDYDQAITLEWLCKYATLTGICSSNKEQTTLRSAKKKLDLLAKIDAIKSDLIKTSNDRIDYAKKINPYNIVVGEQPYIQAFGRLRKGKIVDTIGSRFVVAYCTPSNTDELKYKTLPLSQLWIESGI